MFSTMSPAASTVRNWPPTLPAVSSVMLSALASPTLPLPAISPPPVEVRLIAPSAFTVTGSKPLPMRMSPAEVIVSAPPLNAKVPSSTTARGSGSAMPPTVLPISRSPETVLTSLRAMKPPCTPAGSSPASSPSGGAPKMLSTASCPPSRASAIAPPTTLTPSGPPLTSADGTVPSPGRPTTDAMLSAGGV